MKEVNLLLACHAEWLLLSSSAVPWIVLWYRFTLRFSFHHFVACQSTMNSIP